MGNKNLVGKLRRVFFSEVESRGAAKPTKKNREAEGATKPPDGPKCTKVKKKHAEDETKADRIPKKDARHRGTKPSTTANNKSRAAWSQSNLSIPSADANVIPSVSKDEGRTSKTDSLVPELRLSGDSGTKEIVKDQSACPGSESLRDVLKEFQCTYEHFTHHYCKGQLIRLEETDIADTLLAAQTASDIRESARVFESRISRVIELIKYREKL